MPTMSPETELPQPRPLQRPPVDGKLRDLGREGVETVAFVIVLVLMLKLFVAEAFVIPTGSMAPILWGDQYVCTCKECGHEFPVNVKPTDPTRSVNAAYVCENCGYIETQTTNAKSKLSSGDRVLVSKYDFTFRKPKRFEIPVFRYPKEPFKESDYANQNYIKRLIGLPGETIAQIDGDLYVCTDLTFPAPPDPLKAWEFAYTYHNDPTAVDAFVQRRFKIIRKSPSEILTVRRLVFDLAKQPKSVNGPAKTRWMAEANSGWQLTQSGFTRDGGDWSGVVYQHLDPWRVDPKPEQIVDHVSYNFFRPFGDNNANLVTDLILECSAEFGAKDAGLDLELSKGTTRYRARFENGRCTLFKLEGLPGQPETTTELGSTATKITDKGRHDLRFANVDSRLTVWVDDKVLNFETQSTDYEPSYSRSIATENDLQRPARIAGKGSIQCSKVQLWRDICYTQSRQNESKIPGLDTFYVQPGHYLCFGDNSPSSADSRDWGSVPERMMLGRAVLVYWPYTRWRLIK